MADAPHMLIAGTTGSGKTIFLHAMLVSLLHQYSADELELLIIDPKQTDFIFFEGIPHLYGGKVVIDADEALERIQENTSIANKIIENSIHRKRFSFLGERKSCIKEHTIESYKTDLFLPSTKTIVEIKSVISITDNAIFPTVYSERTLNQLNNIYKLLNNGYRVCFFYNITSSIC